MEEREDKIEQGLIIELNKYDLSHKTGEVMDRGQMTLEGWSRND